MGALFRRYWLPICTSDRLPHPGCAPRAERLLGENFVVFRGRNGAVGVLGEFCLHRGASLALGRVEDCGIRCIYHGWKFGTDGTVLETMNNPAGKRQPRLQTAAYPVVEAGWNSSGPIWGRKSICLRRHASPSWTCRKRTALSCAGTRLQTGCR